MLITGIPFQPNNANPQPLLEFDHWTESPLIEIRVPLADLDEVMIKWSGWHFEDSPERHRSSVYWGIWGANGVKIIKQNSSGHSRMGAH